MIKRFYFDLETSGLDSKLNAILQLAAIIEIDGEVQERINLYIKPFNTDIIDPGATEIHGLDPTEDRFIIPKEAHEQLVKVLDKYIDKYNPKDKMYMVGFNCQHFDKAFLYEWFVKNGNPYMFSYFYPETLDLFVLIGYACQKQRGKLGDSKLVTFSKALGIEVDDKKLHDAEFDTDLVYDLYQIFSQEYPI